MKLVLDIYSGKPNPSWELDAEDADRILEFMEEMPALEHTISPMTPKLGYRGFAVELDDGMTLRLSFHRNFLAAHYSDEEHNLETYYFDSVGFEIYLKDLVVQRVTETGGDMKIIEAMLAEDHIEFV